LKPAENKNSNFEQTMKLNTEKKETQNFIGLDRIIEHYKTTTTRNSNNKTNFLSNQITILFERLERFRV